MKRFALQRTDAELVEASCCGDVAAFRELYERHYRMAVGIAYSRLSDRHLAEDAAQEAFATACHRMALLRDRKRFPEWLGTICRRTANRIARSRKRDTPIVHEPLAAPLGNDRGKMAARVQQALGRLSAASSEIVVLHYFSELSHGEIAMLLNMTPDSVHGRLQRARRQLASDLSEDEE